MATPATQTPAETSFGFMSINMFKQNVGATKLEVLRSPKSNKLFVAADNGMNYNCQQDLDVTLPLSILIPDEDLTKACLINPSASAEVLATL